MKNNDKDIHSTNEKITTLPAAHQRKAAKQKILETVIACLENRIDEVFEMADEAIGEIVWQNLPEVREQICGCLAEDLRNHIGEEVELILEETLLNQGPNSK